MIRGILGKKIGMSQVFLPDGRVVPVTVIEAGPCTVTQLRTSDRDGYRGGSGGVHPSETPQQAPQGSSGTHRPFQASAGGCPRTHWMTSRLVQQVNVDLFQVGEKVDVIGTSKGRGFQGTIKRHGFSGGPRTHGQSDRARAPGSIGGTTTPGRVFKGKKMAGHMGNTRITVKNLEVVEVDPERNLLLVKGGVPGAPNSLLTIRKTG